MKIETKVQLAKLTLYALNLVALLFMFGVLISVVCAGVNINPFREGTSMLLGASFVGLIGLATMLVLLNVATNISLIADAKIIELKLEPQRTRIKRWLLSFVSIAILIVGLIFAGAYFSKEQYIRIVRDQAYEVMRENEALLQEIGIRLASGKVSDYRRIKEICRFLENQRSDLPNLKIIYSGQFSGKTAFYQINESYIGNLDEKENKYTPAYFQCTKDFDCDYLRKFFSNEKVDVLQKYSLRSEEFYIYVPYVGKNSRFILLFDRTNRYGKVGSFS